MSSFFPEMDPRPGRYQAWHKPRTWDPNEDYASLAVQLACCDHNQYGLWARELCGLLKRMPAFPEAANPTRWAVQNRCVSILNNRVWDLLNEEETEVPALLSRGDREGQPFSYAEAKHSLSKLAHVLKRQPGRRDFLLSRATAVLMRKYTAPITLYIARPTPLSKLPRGPDVLDGERGSLVKVLVAQLIARPYHEDPVSSARLADDLCRLLGWRV